MPPSDLQIAVLTISLLVYVSAFINGFYICLHGIRFMDARFSALKDYRQESISPFDRLARMHKYSFVYTFSQRRLVVSRGMHYWLQFTAISLAVHWSMFAAACIAHYSGIDPILVFTLGLG